MASRLPCDPKFLLRPLILWLICCAPASTLCFLPCALVIQCVFLLVELLLSVTCCYFTGAPVYVPALERIEDGQ